MYEMELFCINTMYSMLGVIEEQQIPYQASPVLIHVTAKATLSFESTSLS